jgi:hypothetical protein
MGNYGKLLKYLRNREDWWSFLYSPIWSRVGYIPTNLMIDTIFLDPKRGCKAIDNFFCNGPFNDDYKNE